MSEWTFPNAFAESIRRTAELRGQDANRLEIRDFEDKWPPAGSVSGSDTCPQASGVFVHDALENRSFCKWCGSLIAG